MTSHDEKISVFGLGKLGCTMLACFAHKGWNVIGIDVNQEVVSKVNNGDSPIYEPHVDDMIKLNKDRIEATTDIGYAINRTDISFIIVPTPSLPDGSFSIEYVKAVVAGIGNVLREKKAYHQIVITSTVLPGDMEKIQRLLEEKSGRKCPDEFGLCYNPDFIALGSVVHDFLNPDMVLIGESDPRSGALLESIHSRLCDKAPPVHRMNFHNAELSKIALNCYCTMKISFANTLAELCERMPGGDADKVVAAIGDDKRIGRKYLKPGLSYGGPCFPRDNRAFAMSAARFGVKAMLAESSEKINVYQKKERLPDIVTRIVTESSIGDRPVSILGLTYKPDTPVVEESALIDIIRSLSKRGVRLNLYDPAGMQEAQSQLKDIKDGIHYSKSAQECIKGTSVCIIGTAWNEFKKLAAEDFLGSMLKPITIIDAWHLYDFGMCSGIRHIVVGRQY